MSGQVEPRSFRDLKLLFPDRVEWVRLSGELGNFLLDQSQVSLVACPRNHLHLLGQQVKIRSCPRNHALSLPFVGGLVHGRPNSLGREILGWVGCPRCHKAV